MPRKTKKAEEKLTQIQFVTEATESTGQYYANFASVAHTPYDFSLTFAKVVAPPTSEQVATAKAGNPVKIEPLMQIIIPVRLIQGLTEALITQKKKYEQSFGAIEQPPNSGK